MIKVVSKEVVKNRKFNNTKINNLENKIPDVFILIQTNQSNAYKKISRKKLEMLTEKYQILLVYGQLLFLIQKLEKLRLKYHMLVV